VAPEVIELKGIVPESDIWSLGCTIIELLTGEPPYANMLPVSALYRIVEDAMPPLPAGLSMELEEFLGLCFKKEPSDRPTARALLSHAWIEKWIPGTASLEVGLFESCRTLVVIC
jgi:serine/threonine protein kinase